MPNRDDPFRENREKAEALLAEGRQQGDKRKQATALYLLASLKRVDNKLDEALPLLRESVELFLQTDDHDNQVAALGGLARVLAQLNRRAEAEPLLAQAHVIAGQTGSVPLQIHALTGEAGALQACKDYEAATIQLNKALQLASDDNERADVLVHLGSLQKEQGKRDLGVATIQKARELAAAAGNEQLVASIDSSIETEQLIASLTHFISPKISIKTVLIVLGCIALIVLSVTLPPN